MFGNDRGCTKYVHLDVYQFITRKVQVGPFKIPEFERESQKR